MLSERVENMGDFASIHAFSNGECVRFFEVNLGQEVGWLRVHLYASCSCFVEAERKRRIRLEV